MAIDEKFVRRAIIKWLSRQGYDRKLDEKATTEHGVDIKVRHHKYPRYFLVEAKGEPNPKTNKSVSSAIEVNFIYALGQIVSRMRYKAKYWYAIGLPLVYKEKILRRLPPQICKKLNLNVLIVDKFGKVNKILGNFRVK